MEPLFLKLVNMSIAAGWLLLVVLLLRVLLKKAPRWIFCAFWAIVAVRLICPFSLESVFSLIPSAETVRSDILYAPTPAIQSGVSFLNQAVNPILSDVMSPVQENSANPMQIAVWISSWIWLFGCAVMLAYALVSWIRLKKRVKTAVCTGENVWICDAVDTPFIFGVFRPRVYLPSGLDSQQKAWALAHEQAHLARRDHWWKPLGFLLLTAYWFHPLCWLGYILFCRDVEFACDERVIRRQKIEGRKEYAGALLANSVSCRAVTACPLAFGEVGVKTRIRRVLNYKKPAFWVVLAAIALCAVTSVCFLTNPVVSAPKICVGNGTYAQTGGVSNAIPANAVQIGRLEEVATNQALPEKSMTGAGMSENYEGCSLCMSEDEPQTVYLENPDGGWLCFALESGAAYRPTRRAFDTSEPVSYIPTISYELPEFPDVSFVCGTDCVTAESSGTAIELFSGMPLLNVYFSDLNGDGFREICGTAYWGSGIVDARIYVYDWKNRTLYELSDRGEFDYRLVLQNENLFVVRSPYTEGASFETGILVLREGALSMEQTVAVSGEEVYRTERLLYTNPLSSFLGEDDDGKLYYIDLEQNSMRIVNRANGQLETSIFDSSAQWEELSPENLEELFVLNVWIPEELVSCETFRLLRLPEQYCLIQVDGALWLGTGLTEKNGVWCIYSLCPAASVAATDAP